MISRLSVTRVLLVGCLGIFAGCAQTGPASDAKSPESVRVGGSLLANTGSDVKTFYFIDSHGGRFNDYYGTLGKFTYTYQKTGPATARFKTTWSSDAGNKGESTAELTFTSAYQGNFVATESMNNGTKKTVRGRFTVKSPTGTTIPSGAPTNPPADSTAIVVPTPTPVPQPSQAIPAVGGAPAAPAAPAAPQAQ